MPITVSPYNPLWPTQFAQIRSSLTTLLSSTPHLSIEHVGSTSVPSLPAKPILDIDIIVTPTQLQPVIAALQPTYLYMGELGIADRHAFRAPELLPARNLYVCVEGSAALRNHIAVRELLRRDEGVRREYGALKMDLGSRGLEIHEYMALKSEMMMRILRLSGGLSEEELVTLIKATSSPKRLHPIRTKNLMLREFVITDGDGLVQAGVTRSKKEAQELAIEIIQNAGKKEREHVELVVLSDEEEGEAQIIGRIGVRPVSPEIETTDTNLMKVYHARSRPKEEGVLLYAFFNPALDDRGHVEEAMNAFIPALNPFIPMIAKRLGDEANKGSGHQEANIGTTQSMLEKWKRMKIDEIAIRGGVVYEMERSAMFR